jgi:hypothetical protein
MKCQITISSPAAKDLQESFEWYENLSVGLGFRFIEVVEQVLGIMAFYPESFPQKKKPFREASIKRFPYLIIYEYSPKNHTIYVLHVFNSQQLAKKKYSRK